MNFEEVDSFLDNGIKNINNFKENKINYNFNAKFLARTEKTIKNKEILQPIPEEEDSETYSNISLNLSSAVYLDKIQVINLFFIKFCIEFGIK